MPGVGMAHPKDRSGLTRRQLLKGAAGSALAVGLVARRLREHDHADRRRRRRQTRSSSRPEPARPGRAAAAAAGLRHHAGRSRPTTRRSGRTAARAGPAPGLQLRRLHLARPRQALREEVRHEGAGRDVQLGRRGDRQARRRGGRLRRDHRPLGLEHRQPDRAAAPPAAHHSYLPNLEKNIWPELQDPFYDRGSRYTVPYVVWSDGIGWRNDKLEEDVAAMDVPWDIFWHAQAYRGKVGLLDDKRDALSMPMQRDAMHAARARTSTRRIRRSSRRRATISSSSRASATSR